MQPHATAHGFATVIQDIVTVRFDSSSGMYRVYEGGAGSVGLLLSKPLSTPLTIHLTDAPARDVPWAHGSPATAGVDYTAGPWTATFAAGKTRASFTIRSLEDAEIEGGAAPVGLAYRGYVHRESFGVALDQSRLPAGVVVFSHDVSTILIDDDDMAIASFAKRAATVEENAGTVLLPVIIHRKLSSPFNLYYQRHWRPQSGLPVHHVVVPANARTVEIPFEVVDDNVEEDDEVIHFSLRSSSEAAASWAPNGFTLTIRSNERPFRIEGISDASVEHGSAWQAQARAKNASGAVKAGTGYTVGSASSGSVAIADDDAPETQTVTTLPGTVAAALSNGVVRLARPSGWTGSGKIQFGGGSKTRDKGKFTTLRIGNVDNDGFEVRWASREPGTLRLTLEWQPVAGSSWRPSDGGARDPRVLTIEDPAQPAPQPPAVGPEIAIAAGGGIIEGGSATFTLTATPAPAAPLEVTVTIAVTGAFGITGGERTVTIPTTGSATLTLATTGDGTDEPDGSVSATVKAGSGYTVGTASSGSVAIADDDLPPPEISVSAGTGITEGENATFTVTADRAVDADLAVDAGRHGEGGERFRRRRRRGRA